MTFFKFWLFVAVGCVHSDDDLPRFRLLRIDLSFPRTSSFLSCLCARLRLCHVCLVLSQCFVFGGWLARLHVLFWRFLFGGGLGTGAQFGIVSSPGFRSLFTSWSFGFRLP